MCIQNIISEFNNAIQAHNFSFSPLLELTDIVVTQETISNLTTSTKLTDIILNNYFTKKDNICYHHFTTMSSFEKILESRELRLFAVEKRYKEGEFDSFYTNHGLFGYSLRQNMNGETYAHNLVRNSFYMSFASDGVSEADKNNLWSIFADSGKGVKMIFEIDTIYKGLRNIHYSSGSNDIELLSELQTISVNNYNRQLVLFDISVIGFFYLPGVYSRENEYRLLIKRSHATEYGFNTGNVHGGYEYLSLPFNNPYIPIRLTQIEIGPASNRDDVRAIIKNNNVSEDIIIN